MARPNRIGVTHRRLTMTAMLIFDTALDAAVFTVIIGLLVWGIVADACGVWAVVLPSWRRTTSPRLEPVVAGVT
jgi:hypothetical protein